MSIALVIGAGSGLSASLARNLAQRGHQLVLAARDTSDLAGLISETGASAIDCDASSTTDMENLFTQVDAMDSNLEVAVYNPSGRLRGPITELDPDAVKNAMLVTAFGAFLMARQCARRMLARGTGAMLFTGASAGVKGFPQSAPFAMGKFALRGLCQSLARELHPQGIHIGHFVIDGGIAAATSPGNDEDAMLSPDAIAQTYMHFLDQHRSAWSWEIELRPWVETF